MTASVQDGLDSGAELATVAVFCKRVTDNALHAGFLYRREESGAIWRCEMAWDFDCRNRETTQCDDVWVNVNLRPENLDFLAAVLETMDQNKSAIPYDVVLDGPEHFDRFTWSYIQGASGLTCATFIVALLHSLRFDLLATSEWPSRVEDAASLEALIRKLEKGGVDPGRIANMRANHGNKRFRPEEVCGAVGEETWPVRFHVAASLGEDVKHYIHRRAKQIN